MHLGYNLGGKVSSQEVLGSIGYFQDFSFPFGMEVILIVVIISHFDHLPLKHRRNPSDPCMAYLHTCSIENQSNVGTYTIRESYGEESPP